MTIRNINDAWGEASEFQTVADMEQAILACGGDFRLPADGLVEGRDYEVVRLMETWTVTDYTGQYDAAMRPAALQGGDHVLLPGGDAEADAREWSGFRALMDRAGLELGDDWEQDEDGRDEVSLVKRHG